MSVQAYASAVPVREKGARPPLARVFSPLIWRKS